MMIYFRDRLGLESADDVCRSPCAQFNQRGRQCVEDAHRDRWVVEIDRA